MNDFFAWQELITIGGAVTATGIITQFFKNMPFCKCVNNQLIAYVVALIVLFGGNFFVGDLTLDVAAMIPLNAILVTAGANSAFDALNSVLGKKQ